MSYLNVQKTNNILTISLDAVKDGVIDSPSKVVNSYGASLGADNFSLTLKHQDGKLLVDYNVTTRQLILDHSNFLTRDIASHHYHWHPHCAGLIISYLAYEGVIDAVNEFLDEHFPDTVFAPLSNFEKSTFLEVINDESSDSLDSHKNLIETFLRLYHAAFPIWSRFIDNRPSDGFYNSISYSATPRSYYSSTSVRELLESVFGGYRKDLMKAFTAIDKHLIPDLASWVNNFTRLIEIDYFVYALTTYSFVERCDERQIDMSALENFPRSTVHRLFIDGFESITYDTELLDALHMAPSIPASHRKGCNTWKKLHDEGIIHFVYDKNHRHIQHPEALAQFFNESHFENLILSPLMTTSDYVATGKAMKNCVGGLSYVSHALQGDGYCFRFDDCDAQPYALVEIAQTYKNNWKIKQIKGIENVSLPLEFEQNVKNQLSTYLPLEVENYA